MKTVLLSYFSALRSLARPGVFWHLVWPTLLATFLWTAAMLTRKQLQNQTGLTPVVTVEHERFIGRT